MDPRLFTLLLSSGLVLAPIGWLLRVIRQKHWASQRHKRVWQIMTVVMFCTDVPLAIFASRHSFGPSDLFQAMLVVTSFGAMVIWLVAYIRGWILER